MGIGPGVEDDSIMSTGRGVDRVDQGAFAVVLAKIHLDPQRLGLVAAHSLDIGEGGGAVDIGLTLAKQVEVGPVEDQDRGHAMISLVPMGCRPPCKLMSR